MLVESACKLETGVLVPVVLEWSDLYSGVRPVAGRVQDRLDLVEDNITSWSDSQSTASPKDMDT